MSYQKSYAFAPFAPQKVENELHFMLECSLYKTQRANLINPLINMTHGFTYFTGSQKLEYLVRNVETNISSYIANCFDITTLLTIKTEGTKLTALETRYIW